MEKYLKVGTILKTIGLKGDVKVFSTTSFKDIRYKKGNVLFVLINSEYKSLTIESHSFKGGNFDQIKFKEINSIEEAEKLLSHDFFALKDESILFENEFFYEDLIGLEVYDSDSNKLGTVASVEEFPAQITLKISKKPAKGEFFVPFNDFFIKNVDLKNKKITINVIEGLID